MMRQADPKVQKVGRKVFVENWVVSRKYYIQINVRATDRARPSTRQGYEAIGDKNDPEENISVISPAGADILMLILM